jgi:anti-sigma-K factor RskA
MKSFAKRGKELDEQEVALLQTYLQSTLKPAEPRPEYIGGLGSRLRAHVQADSSQHKEQHVGLWVGMGLLTSLVVVVTGIRAAMTIAALSGLLYQNRESHKAVRSIA